MCSSCWSMNAAVRCTTKRSSSLSLYVTFPFTCAMCRAVWGVKIFLKSWAYDAFVAMVHSACNVVHHIMVQPLFLAVLEVGSAAAATILQDAWQLQ